MADSEHSDWTERHRPNSVIELEGNMARRKTISTWLQNWVNDEPKKRGLLLVGPPGVGKTSIAKAMARDHGWNIIEMNASDDRNAAKIRKAATRGSVNRSLFDHQEGGGDSKTLILLDEVDHLSGRFSVSEEMIGNAINATANSKKPTLKGDSGGKGELLNLLINTQQPVIMTCNDEMRLWGLGKGWKQRRDKFLRWVTRVEFLRVESEAMRRIVNKICTKEKYVIEPIVIDMLVKSNPGDLRALVKDLQVLASAAIQNVITSEIAAPILRVGQRNSSEGLFPGLEKLYKSSASESREISLQLDKDPDELIAWISWNNLLISNNNNIIKKSAKSLSVADKALLVRFQNRAYRSWYWAGAITSMAASLAGSTRKQDKIYASYPDFLRRGFQAWRRDGLLEKLAKTCGCSLKSAREELYLPLAALHSKDNSAFDPNDLSISLSLGLDFEEHVMLCGLKVSSELAKSIENKYEQLKTVNEVPPIVEELSPEYDSSESGQATLF